METRVRRWGNSLALRIPRDLARGTGLTDGSTVMLTHEGGRLVVTPCRPDVPTLAELLAKVTPANLHREIDSGPPVGDEEW